MQSDVHVSKCDHLGIQRPDLVVFNLCEAF